MLRSAEALPARDMPVLNDALKIEWFYMWFHQEDRNRHLESGRRLCDKTLAIVVEYFVNIFNSQMANGSLMKKREKQIEFHAKCELHHEMAKRYNDKIRHFANQRYMDVTTAATSVATRIVEPSTRIAPTSVTTGTRVTTGAMTGPTGPQDSPQVQRQGL